MSEVYEVIKNIGGGSFGQVYLVRHKREEKQYVIKKIKTRDMSQKDRENTENEVRLLQKLRHTNIVAYKDSYMDREQYLNIVMVYCEGGDIYQKIKQCKGKHFTETQILDWMAQMALALYYLHDKKILHRDLKTQNIFLKNGRVRLGDFGIAKMLDSTRDFANTCIGTPYYMSPELFKYKPYSYKSDIWAFGCCVYEMCNLRHAFDAQSLNGLAVKIMKGSFPPITNTYSKGLRDLIGKMISINPKNRPTIWELINKPLLKKRIIAYTQELFSGKYPEGNNPMDVDDVYLDSLREQGEKLGIMAQIEKQLQNPGLDIQDIQQSQKSNAQIQREKEAQERVTQKKKELWRELREKRKIEEEIKKLEKKKQIQEIKRKEQIEQQKEQNQQQQQRNSRKNQSQNPTDRQNYRKQVERSSERQNSQNQQQNSKRSYSYERKRDSSLNNKNDVKKQNQHSTSQSKFHAKQPQSSSSQNSQSNRPPVSQISTKMDSQDDLSDFSSQQQQQQLSDDRRDIILQQKNLKKKEEQQRWEQQFNQIQQENAQMRQQAAKKQQAQYRPSTGMLDAIGDEQNTPNTQNNKYNSNNEIQDYSMDNNNEEIQEYLDNEQYKQQYLEEESEAQYNLQQQASKSQAQEQQQQPQQSKKNLKIEEEYGMEDEQYYDEEEEEDKEEEQVIQEVENEDSDHDGDDENDNNQIESKIEQMKTKLMHKTSKINQLQQSMKPVTPALSQSRNIDIQESLEDSQMNQTEESQDVHQEEEDIDFDIEELEEDYNEEEGELPQEAKLNQNPQYQKINDRVKLLRHRCEAGLGNVIFQQAYDFLKNCGSQRVDNVRKQMMKILGEDMIGFWHLIDQVLVLENILLTVPQYIDP